jgi:phenylpropionate dioxygenase-like ring-hydroxylating dioxygenase large terminal subunit
VSRSLQQLHEEEEMFLLNAWYAVAWSHEIGRSLFARRVCDKPMVLYRREDGGLVALEDLCWHRMLPLSQGWLEGDCVRCKYHGLLYDACGQCVQMPAQETVAKSACVNAYPVAERHRLVWVWPGDPSRADESLIPNLYWFSDPKWAGDGASAHFNCGYQLLVDNLLDLTHETYVHPETIGSDHIPDAPLKTEARGEEIVVSRWMLDHEPASFWKRQIGTDKNCDRWQIAHWTPPANVVIDVGVAVAGTGAPEGDRRQGISMRVVNSVTPETETSCWYFFGNPRDYKIEDRELTAAIMQSVAGIFEQDRRILESQQQAILENPERKLMNLNIDAGSVRARRILESKLKAETERQGPAATA